MPMEGLDGIDFRGIPTHECPVCGSSTFRIAAGFMDYNIAWWGTDAECYECKTKVTVPTPVDDPNHSE